MSRAVLKLLVAFLFVSLPVVGPFAAQDKAAPAEGPTPATSPAPGDERSDAAEKKPETVSAGPTLEKIAARLKEIEEQEGLDAELKSKIVEALQKAQTSLKNAEKLKTQAESYKKSIESAPKAVEEAQGHLKEAAAEKTDEPPPVPTTSDPKELAVEVKKLQAEVASAKAGLDKKASDVAAQQGRPEKAREEQTAAKERLAAIDKSLKTEPAAGENPLLFQANRSALEARRIERTEEIAMLEQEILSHAPRLELLKAEQELSKLALSRLEARLKAFQEAESKARTQEAEAARIEAEQAQREAAGKHPVITKVAEENTKLGEELTRIVEEESRVRPARDLKASTAKQLKEVYDRTKAQIEVAGVGGVGGTVLRERRKQLPDIIRDNQDVADRWSEEIPKAEARIFQIGLDRNDLSQLDAAVKDRIAKAEKEVPEARREEIARDLREQLVSRQELLKKLEGTYTTYVAALRDLEKTQSELDTTARDFAQLLDEWLLWIPSSQPPSMSTLTNLWNAFLWLLSPEHWVDAGQALLRDFGQHPVLPVLTLLLCAGLFMARPRMSRKYGEIADRVGSIQRDAISHTLAALLLSLLLVLPIPLATAFVGWRLTAEAAASTFAFVGALGKGLLSLAGLFFAVRFFSVLCGSRGVAEVHFRWRKETLGLLRKHVSWLVWVLPLMFFLVTLTDSQPNEDIHNSLGRLTFVVGMGALGVFIQRVIRPKGALIAPILSKAPDGWLSRLRYIWYPLAVGVPLILALIAAIGYYYTAIALETRLAASVALVVGAILLEQLGERWLLVTARRLAVEKAREARKAREEAAKAAGQAPEGSSAEEVVVDVPEVDIATVNDQTRRLLRTAVDLGILFGLWGIWASVLPALGIFNEVELWQTQVIDETGTQIWKWITLQNVILALIALVITVVAAKNLPGALEIAVLKNLPLEAGMRYALATVSQYVVTVVGIIISFQLIGVGWAKVQWLVAALSVGIGFGLQEIIANFFCGLILLFERPIRIGDIVRVGDVMGTVSKIRIRATTITDWDRMDYIVPNKELITGRLLNWTLSNTVNRIVINVGISYGSDPEKARELLLKIAKEHPLIMDDPGPLATFEGFGDSTLSCVLRCYLPDFANRLATINELHSTINKAFKEAGIEIAFPQLDLHVRTSGVPEILKGESAK